jgi:epoxyqueuosine reductase QueG
MLEKLEALPQKLGFTPTHAVIALFEGRAEIGKSGGDYSQNGDMLRKDCEKLRLEHSEYHFAESRNAWPLPAVQSARLAGLGVVGLNGLLFAPGLGSSVSIGAVFTDMPLSNGISEGGGYCVPCGECVRLCPTGALTYEEGPGGPSGDGISFHHRAEGAGRLDISGKRGFNHLKCLAYLRQREGAALEREGYYGCDICQDVCPMNRAGALRGQAAAPTMNSL